MIHYVINKSFQGLKTYISGYDYEDIVQVGNIGLWKACLSYNPDKSKFTTYAIRIIYNEILMTIRNSKRNLILNNSISLNSVVTNDKDDSETELGDILISDNSANDISLAELRAYICDKYKNSEKKLNIINSYIFDNMTQVEIGRKYGYSQTHIHRILKKFKVPRKHT